MRYLLKNRESPHRGTLQTLVLPLLRGARGDREDCRKKTILNKIPPSQLKSKPSSPSSHTHHEALAARTTTAPRQIPNRRNPRRRRIRCHLPRSKPQRRQISRHQNPECQRSRSTKLSRITNQICQRSFIFSQVQPSPRRPSLRSFSRNGRKYSIVVHGDGINRRN